jgi:hypothetical protein
MISPDSGIFFGQRKRSLETDLPMRYLYLATIGTGHVLEVFSVDHLDHERDIIAYGTELRTRFGVDEPKGGLTLLDSLIHPLERDTLAMVLHAHKAA